MDPLLLLSEALFGLIFVSAVRQAWIRRDAVSADVVLVFLPMAIVLSLEVFRLIYGDLDATVGVLAIALLLAQPVFTLRLAGRVRTIPRWTVPLAAAAWAVTVVPLVVPILAAGAEASPILLLAAVIVFVIGEAVAAILLADAARRRSSAGGTRLWIAAVATALFGLSILAFGTANATSAGEPSQLIGRLMAIVAALGYVAAFLPPRPLRRAWHAQTAYGGLRDLLDAQAEPSATDLAPLPDHRADRQRCDRGPGHRARRRRRRRWLGGHGRWPAGRLIGRRSRRPSPVCPVGCASAILATAPSARSSPRRWRQRGALRRRRPPWAGSSTGAHPGQPPSEPVRRRRHDPDPGARAAGGRPRRAP